MTAVSRTVEGVIEKMIRTTNPPWFQALDHEIYANGVISVRMC
jgi:hypothetical protein